MTNKYLFLMLLALGTLGIALLTPFAPAAPKVLAAPNYQQSPLSTPTTTPTKVIKLVNELTHPQAGDAVSGVVELHGTAASKAFRKYEVHIAVASSESWRWLLTNFEVVYDDTVYRLDTHAYPDGFYDIRVRVIRDDGNYSEAFLRNLEIRNAHPPTATPAFNPQGTQLPTPTPTLPTATPTPIPEFISNISDGQGIFAPYTNQVVRGLVRVVGTVNGKPNIPYARFELALSPNGYNRWDFLFGSDQQFWQAPIYTWDTRQWPDGAYDLRLRVIYENGNYDEYQVRNLAVANYTAVYRPTATATPQTKGIFIPASGAMVTGTIAITGTATVANFQRWELSWSTSGKEEWSLLVDSTIPLSNNLLARLDLTHLPIGFYDLRLRVFNWSNQYVDYFSRRLQIAPPTPTPPPAAVITQTQAITP